MTAVFIRRKINEKKNPVGRIFKVDLQIVSNLVDTPKIPIICVILYK